MTELLKIGQTMTNIQHVNFVTYRDKYFNKAEHQLIDVRSGYEFRQGHVPNAINIPLDDLGLRMNEISHDRPIIVICASGNRSQIATRQLQQAGYQSVYNFQGGTMVWMMNGLQLAY